VPEIKALSRYVSHLKGGQGCVRDVIEQVLKVQEKWNYSTTISAKYD
jgi:3-deoxy-D-manno-octulosonate 8-phosphate phosphatase (KDO 8-P phosphatase)